MERFTLVCLHFSNLNARLKDSRGHDDVGVLPSTGRSESVGRHPLRLTSCQSLEHLEQVPSQPPDDGETSTQSVSVALNKTTSGTTQVFLSSKSNT